MDRARIFVEENYTLFDSPVGPIGLVWTKQGLKALLLPEKTRRATELEIQKRYPSAGPKTSSSQIQRIIRQIQGLLAGKPETFSRVTLDLSSVSVFYRSVYEAARAIPPGQTQSYGQIAQALGKKGAARAVGQALGRNPIAIIIPCHRVLGQNGAIGGFSAPGGTKTKVQLLELEQWSGKPISASVKKRSPSPAPARAKAHRSELPLGAAFLRKTEPKFRPIIDRAGPMRLETKKKADVFSAFAKAITHQQLNGKAAASIWARVSALGDGGFTATFAASAPLALLRSAGLSEAKALSIRDLAERILSGEIPERRALARLSDEAIVQTMTSVRGVGRWTVEMFLIFDLGRPDVLSTGDYGVRKGYSVVFGTPELPSPKELAEYGQRWAPHRTAATWYLWRALEKDS